MSSSLRRPLTLDDPLAGGSSSRPVVAESPEAIPALTSRQAIRKPASDSGPAAARPATKEWRDWTGGTRVTSFRLPDELLDELAGTTDRLGLPIGQTIVAALTSLLDEDDATVIDRVDRAAQTLRRGKRAAQRRQAATATLDT